MCLPHTLIQLLLLSCINFSFSHNFKDKIIILKTDVNNQKVKNK